MNKQEFISSGILENYVLGICTEAERLEVEEYLEIYPEIKDELDKIESALEAYANMKAITPPDGIQQKILDELNQPNDIPVKSIQPQNPIWKYASIAAVLASVVLFGFLMRERNTRMSAESELANTIENCNDTEQRLVDKIAILRNTSGQVIAMNGTPKSPDSSTKVYWDETNKTTYLDVINLPTPPADKQYQLWAIVEGTPVSMGVFDVGSDGDSLKAVPHVDNAAAFAITLERLGGSPTPNLEEMVVIGNV